MEIKATNSVPKGFHKWLYWFLLALGIVLAPFVLGLFVLIIPVCSLFLIPARYKYGRDRYMYMLSETALHRYHPDGREVWSIPWKDIDYLKVRRVGNKYAPKSVLIKLSDRAHFLKSLEDSKTGKEGSFEKLSRLSFSSKLMSLQDKFGIKQPEVVLEYFSFDRSADSFVTLLQSYRW